MKKTTILNQIRNNKRFEQIEKIYKILVSKYGPVTIAGGCLVDAYYDMDSYDIDCFINYRDLKEEWIQDYSKQKTNIVDVIRDEIEGFDIDVVVVRYEVSEHIHRFDQCFKQIWIDNNGLNISRRAVKDISKGQITLGSLNGPVVYFRVLKSAKKYGLKVKQTDIFLMETYMSSLKKVHIPDKYKKMKHLFTRIENPDLTIGYLVADYSQLYWNLEVEKLPSWTYMKAILMPLIIKHKILSFISR